MDFDYTLKHRRRLIYLNLFSRFAFRCVHTDLFLSLDSVGVDGTSCVKMLEYFHSLFIQYSHPVCYLISYFPSLLQVERVRTIYQ